ncbi:MAG TPA: protoporphyrinogen oxidase [Candidatus Binatia bacterium]|nr:protoporphyrinogen oxidase [Candidatus Binatia bacterium]
MSRRRVAVVGGGVAGLAAAHRLVERGSEVVLLEAAERLGGTIVTEHAGGFVVEGGPDAFITEKPWGLALCERLGVTGDLVGTREGDRRTYVASGGRIHPLPEGFLLLAPTDLRALAASPLFSWRGKLRMALDLVLPRGRTAADESLAAFVRRRLGREALERVADPLVGGIYTADPERLSLAATMPRFLEIERRHRSVILGLRAAARAAPAAGARYGLFVTHRDGMGALVSAIARRLPAGAVRLRTPVTGLAREGGRWRLAAGGEAIAADGVVLATPAHQAARLLAALDDALARALAGIDYASSATVTLGYRAADAPALRGFGFVVPAAEGRPLLACTFASRKFRHRAPEGHELLRAFVGGARRPEVAGLPDDVLTALVRAELRTLLGIVAEPLLLRVHRYPRAMPQYAVGHLERVAAIEARAAALPGLALAGAGYRGVGLPDCVRGGEAAADAVG